MKRKFYKLLSIAKHVLFALALTVFFGTAYSQTTYTFNYTGSVQTITLQAGSYSIECWGADGGAGGTATALTGTGGIGGYSKGVYAVVATTTLYIYVGGIGQSTNTTGASVISAAGGWNGGGGGRNGASNSYYRGGGGGGTDVRTTQNNAYANRIIVAGGGGGAGGSSGTPLTWVGSGGNGGGTLGQDGVLGGSQTNHNGKGGTQSAGGAGGINGGNIGVNGSLGDGGDGGGTSNAFPAGGGGGGYYGGGGGATQGGGGGGGSSYIGGVTSATTIMFGQPGFVTNPDIAKNGKVLITELCSIMIISSSTGTVSPSTLCSGNSLTLTTTAVSGYSWSTGATTSSIVVGPTTNTVYSLTGTSSLACTAGTSMSVTVSSGLPVLSIVSSTNNTCLGKTVTLTANGALTYTWSNGVINGASYSPSVTNTYTVIGQNGCGTVTAQTSITVAPIQLNAISSPTVVCAGSPSTLSAVAAATSFTWYPNSPNTASIVVSPTASIVYTVTATDGTCSGVTTVSVDVNPVPTISIVASTSVVCAGNPVYMTASGGINYTWTPGNLSGSSVTVNPLGATLYSVVGDNSVACTSSTTQIVLTNTSPAVGVAASSTFVCSGDVVNLVANGNAGSYAWTNGPATANHAVNPVASSIYTVVGTSSGNGCTTTKTIEVTVFVFPVSISTPSFTICSGTSLTLTASGADSFNWVNGPQGAENPITPTVTSTYTVSGSTSSLAITCSYSGTVQITVNPNPTVLATSNRTTICKGESTTLNATGAPNFSWSSGSTTSAASVSPNTVNIFTYSVTGTDANNCKNMATIQVKVNNCTGIENLNANVSKLAVYPNPSNGEFTIELDQEIIGHEISLKLVNALGQEIKAISLNSANNYKAIVSGLPGGIYFIATPDGRQELHKRIIIEK